MTHHADPSLADMIEANAERFADQPAYISSAGTLTHGELYERAVAVAAGLAGLGLRRQDRISLLARNILEFGETLAAAHLSGLVAATVNFRLTAAERAAIVADTSPRALVCEASYLDDVRRTRSLFPTVEHVIVIGEAELSPRAGEVAYDDLRVAGTGAPLPFRAVGDDVACLIYTSGTTGASKGCVLGHREMRALAYTMNAEMRTGPHDRVLLSMPLFHIGAMAIGLGLHARGGCSVLHSSFEPEAILREAGPRNITVLHLAPTMLQALLDAMTSPRQLDGVSTVVYSAAPITAGGLAAALEAMPGAGFLNLYGQTEVITSGLPRELHSTGHDPLTRRRMSSVGHPFPDTFVRIVDDTGSELPRGVPGEIVVRSPAMFRGYWNNSKATAETIRDGWCHTGDVGILDPDGLIRLVDRKKDVVVTGGENVYCPEVESAITRHPAIAACAVLGLPDSRWGEVVTAVVVAREESRPTLGELQAYLRDHLAAYKLPRRMEFIEELPVLPTGKVDKLALRAQYGAPTASNRA